MNIPSRSRRAQPLKITLVWTDPPGSSAAITLVNLDLEVIGPGGGVRYAGSQWNLELIGDLKESLVNPAGADTLNNVEGILDQVAGDDLHHPGHGYQRPGFAEGVVPGLRPCGHGRREPGRHGHDQHPVRRVDDSASNNDGVIDPGETINLDIMLENTGGAAVNSTNALLATATAGITVTTPTGAYGTIAASGTRPTRRHTSSRLTRR